MHLYKMALPASWEDVLCAPTIIVHMDSHLERRDPCRMRVENAGYTDVRWFPAVNGNDSNAWACHDIRFDPSWMVPHAAGCMLSHLGIWRHIITNEIPYATVFEDDSIFHKQWHMLAPQYYNATPKDADIIFMGHHCGNVYPDIHVVRVPVYCTNAYVVSLEGAQKLYHMITQYPYNDNHAIDMMLFRLKTEQLNGNISNGMPKLEWYVWNSEMYPDKDAQNLIHPDLVHKDKGLVFQQWCR